MPFLFLIIVNLLAYALFAMDKRRAERGTWRIKEGTLLLPVVFGGGAGAYYAMRQFRHKTRKGSFRLAFWACACLSIVGWVAFSFAPPGAI